MNWPERTHPHPRFAHADGRSASPPQSVRGRHAARVAAGRLAGRLVAPRRPDLLLCGARHEAVAAAWRDLEAGCTG